MGTPSRIRQELAQEAARIMLDDGIRDFALAKRKAAEHLGVDNRHEMPGNLEIQDAAIERSRLFASPASRAAYRERLAAALIVMERLRHLEPRLVGPLLQGLVESQPLLNLHGFAETVEEVILELGERGIQCETGERRYRSRQGREQRIPFLAFRGPDDTDVELTVFPLDGLRQSPPSPVDGRPMPRATRAEVERLLAEADAEEAPAPAD
ncbi:MULTISPECIES: hypothetical protein [unclassified Thioalkalivibrio]|uniref:hypothetical protein n=1 Tax=unclassified Thioalkalivibrio TaxID=2621013 RepID=UPI000364F117|nr:MULTISPECIES: hypothetical protein [unclassified Thioalkalivibrio]